MHGCWRPCDQEEELARQEPRSLAFLGRVGVWGLEKDHGESRSHGELATEPKRRPRLPASAVMPHEHVERTGGEHLCSTHRSCQILFLPNLPQTLKDNPAPAHPPLPGCDAEHPAAFPRFLPPHHVRPSTPTAHTQSRCAEPASVSAGVVLVSALPPCRSTTSGSSLLWAPFLQGSLASPGAAHGSSPRGQVLACPRCSLRLCCLQRVQLGLHRHSPHPWRPSPVA